MSLILFLMSLDSVSQVDFKKSLCRRSAFYITGLPLRSCWTIGAPSVSGAIRFSQCQWWDSNPRPYDFQANALLLCYAVGGEVANMCTHVGCFSFFKDSSLNTGRGGYKTGGGGTCSFTPTKRGGGKSFSHAEGGHKKLYGSFYALPLSFSHIVGGAQKVSTL